MSGVGGDQLHVIVADVIKSFDTVDRSIIDCALGRLGLPAWFRKVYFAYHSQVRLRFELSAGLGEPWCRDGGIPQGCPLSMIFIVALYVPWCRHLEAVLAVTPKLYADNLKCSAVCPNALFGADRFTAEYAAAVLGWRHQSELLIDARRVLLNARNHWYPIMLHLHRFMIAVSRVAVNHGGRGGSAPDPLVLDQGGRLKQRRIDIRANVDPASLPGPTVFSGGPWVQVHGLHHWF